MKIFDKMYTKINAVLMSNLTNKSTTTKARLRICKRAVYL